MDELPISARAPAADEPPDTAPMHIRIVEIDSGRTCLLYTFGAAPEATP